MSAGWQFLDILVIYQYIKRIKKTDYGTNPAFSNRRLAYCTGIA